MKGGGRSTCRGSQAAQRPAEDRIGPGAATHSVSSHRFVTCEGWWSAAERRGNSLQGLDDFCLKANARFPRGSVARRRSNRTWVGDTFNSEPACSYESAGRSRRQHLTGGPHRSCTRNRTSGRPPWNRPVQTWKIESDLVRPHTSRKRDATGCEVPPRCSRLRGATARKGGVGWGISI